MNIIQLTQAELQENLPFSLNLVEKGHTLKVTTNKGIVCIISPVASVAQDPQEPELNIPKICSLEVARTFLDKNNAWLVGQLRHIFLQSTMQNKYVDC